MLLDPQLVMLASSSLPSPGSSRVSQVPMQFAP